MSVESGHPRLSERQPRSPGLAPKSLLQGANDQMQLQDQDLDLSTLEAGELGFNSIECNVDGANPGCEAMFDYIGPAPAN